MLLRVYSILVLVTFLLVTSACSQKEESAIFPANNGFPTGDCSSTAHKTRYVVKKKDGSIVRVHANSREEMLENYVRPNLNKLEFVETDQLIYANDLIVPAEREINENSVATWGADRIQAKVAWDQNIKGQGVTVAVIDSGVAINHSSLSSKIYVNEAELFGIPGVDDDGNGYIDDIRGWDFARKSPLNNDTSGHGTHVAGVISGSHSGPMKGVAPEAKILPLDFMEGGSGFTSDAIEAIEYAKSNGARVINASWGSSFCSKLLEDKINSLVNKNVLFVAAAGNSGNNISYWPEYPAAFISEAQITVGSITQRGFMSSFSNYGNLVDVMAPGDEILSTYLGNDYVYLSGTSMAAPFVSGLAALLVQKKPDITVHQLKSILLNSVVKRNYQIKTQGEISVPNALSAVDNL